jgi:catechol 2,3-dioxygenase-like lactoylglutathione lyase family enzyme
MLFSGLPGHGRDPSAERERTMSNRIRIARPTSDAKAALRFYVEGLGGARIDLFRDHAGYSGDIVQLPGCDVEIEFVHGPAMSHAPAPTPEDALVLPEVSPSDIALTTQRLSRLGHAPVRTESPYWHDLAVAWRDPDSYLVLLLRDGAGAEDRRP